MLTLNPRPQNLYETKKSEAETYSYIAMSDREDNDSDAPEEFTFDQGAKIDKEIRKVQIENRTRAVREKKESRRESNLKWAEKLTPRPSGKGQNAKDAVEAEVQESMGNEGMLPNDIVCILHKIDLKSG